MSLLVEQERGPLSIVRACAALGMCRATLYRRASSLGKLRRCGTRVVPRKLSAEERAAVLAVLTEPRFVDQPPAEIYATLASEGRYVGSERTMYRVLAEQQAVRERRAQRVHPKPSKPTLVSTAPNQVWTWDITLVAGPVARSFFYVYVMLDLFSRYVVGWLVSAEQNGATAAAWARETIALRGVDPSKLVVHSDRGSPMKSESMAQLCVRLGVRQSFSRPRVSDDNAHVESHFKTAKYQPDYPGRFEGQSHVVEWFSEYFCWYNKDHHHEGLALYTPAEVYEGRVEEAVAQRQRTLDAAYAAHPERFVKGPPKAARPAAWVGINHVPQAPLERTQTAQQPALCPPPAQLPDAGEEAPSRARTAASNTSDTSALTGATSTSARAPARARRGDGAVHNARS